VVVRPIRDVERVVVAAENVVVGLVCGMKMNPKPKPNPHPTCILGTLHALLGLPCCLQNGSPLMLLVDSI